MHGNERDGKDVSGFKRSLSHRVRRSDEIARQGREHTNYVDDISVLGAWHSYEEVVWFDIAVNEGFVMNGLDTSDLSGGKEQPMSTGQG